MQCSDKKYQHNAEKQRLGRVFKASWIGWRAFLCFASLGLACEAGQEKQATAIPQEKYPAIAIIRPVPPLPTVLIFP